MKLFAAGFMVAIGACANAQTIRFVEWYHSSNGLPGSVTGQVEYAIGHWINVSYSGHVVNETQINNIGTNYWTGYNGGPSPYIYTPNRVDIIALAGQLSGNIVNTITFAQPVRNPIMNIVSLGQAAQPSFYDFNQPFEILSQGQGYWGGNTNGLSNPSGNRLSGHDANGTIRFNGMISSISWTCTPADYWNGFNVGVDMVPEPGSMIAIAAGVGFLIRRRKR